MPLHRYVMTVSWTGNLGTGTSSYRAYDRAHELTAPGKASIAGSSDPQFRGDPGRYNPEELLVGSLSACHMLWYLHLCAEAGVVVERYVDAAEGAMEIDADGGGHFTQVVLRPRCTYREPVEAARIVQLHAVAHARCFVANSMNFPVRVEPGDV
ncbi:MAG: OsmC family protein [Gemmatimonadetes bacterium]|nr:OsmC family protein [Gemmatimonadota bacterium]MCC6774645.1 OsmC family protein [Gemmatimonadaceae bacterium]